MNCPDCGIPYDGAAPENENGLYACAVCDFTGHLVEWDWGEPEDDEEPVA